MNDLVKSNEGLIYFVINKLHLSYMQDDIYDLGLIGLVRASQTYSEDKGSFSTYACKCIANEFTRELKKINSKKRNGITISLSQTLTEDEHLTIEDIIPSDINIEEDILLKEQMEQLYSLMNKFLDKEELEIIERSFGLNGYEETTQADLAKILNKNKSVINKKLQKALNKLRARVPREIDIMK